MTDLHTGPAQVAASPHAIRTATFPHARHGLEEREVRAFLERLAAEVEVADAERTSLRTEAAELRQQVQDLSATQPDEDRIRTEISVRAVELLSRAQQAADDAVAEAEQYARDLVMTAREQYRDVLHRAQDAAAGLAGAGAGAGAPDGTADGAVGYSQPVPEIEYVRTFARVAQAQLKSVLDALADEVDKLGQLPQLPGERGGSPAPQPAQPPQDRPQDPPQDAPQRRARWLSEGLPSRPVEERSAP